MSIHQAVGVPPALLLFWSDLRYARTPFAGRHVAHGWRATFSTVMNERRPADRTVIDLALGHVLKHDDGTIAKVEGAYNRAQHLAPRRRVFEEWAAILTS